MTNLTVPTEEDWHTGRKDGGHSVEKGRHRLSPSGRRQRFSPYFVGSLKGRLRKVVMEGCVHLSRQGKCSLPRSLPTCSMIRCKSVSAPGRAVARQQASKRSRRPPVRRRGQKRQTREGRAAGDNGADRGECRLPCIAGHANARQGKRHLIASDCSRNAIEHTEDGADEWRARARKDELSKRQCRAARQQSDSDRTGDTRLAMKHRQSRGESGEGRKRVDSQREQQLAEEAEADDAENDADSKHGGSP